VLGTTPTVVLSLPKGSSAPSSRLGRETRHTRAAAAAAAAAGETSSTSASASAGAGAGAGAEVLAEEVLVALAFPPPTAFSSPASSVQAMDTVRLPAAKAAWISLATSRDAC